MPSTLLQKEKEGFIRSSLTAGFTLVETLVAISILLVVIIGPMTIAQKGIQNAYFARDQLTAVFLAQEAIEAVREIRDDTALGVYDDLVDPAPPAPSPGDTWTWYDNFVDDPQSRGSDDCTNGVGCKFDPDSRLFGECGDDGNGCQLRVTSDGKYTYDLLEPLSVYTRKVYIESVGLNAVKVRVKVEWSASTFGGITRDVELETWLYDRYKHYESD